MLVSLVLAVTGTVEFRVPSSATTLALAVLGVALSRSFDTASLPLFRQNWALIIVVGLVILVLSMLGAWILIRFFKFDPATAYFGALPGGATSMTAMSEEFGGDMRIVAIMQYSRLIIVILLATFVAYLSQIINRPAIPAIPMAFDRVYSMRDYLLSAATIIAGGYLGKYSRFPAGTMLFPLMAGLIMKAAGLFNPALLCGIYEATYIVLGINVGMKYTKQFILSVLKVIPLMVVFTLLLIIICAGMGWALTALLGIDLLTTYLATTPGGINSVIIAAYESGSNFSLVVTVQIFRLLIIVMAGPLVIRHILRKNRSVTASRQKRA